MAQKGWDFGLLLSGGRYRPRKSVILCDLKWSWEAGLVNLFEKIAEFRCRAGMQNSANPPVNYLEKSM